MEGKHPPRQDGFLCQKCKGTGKNQQNHSRVGNEHRGHQTGILLRDQRRCFFPSEKRRKRVCPVGKTADKEMQRAGCGNIDHTARKNRRAGFTVLRQNLPVGHPHREKTERHTAKPCRNQQGQPPLLPGSVQIRFPRKQSAVTRTCRDHTQTKVAHKHQQCAERAEERIPSVPFPFLRIHVPFPPLYGFRLAFANQNVF